MLLVAVVLAEHMDLHLAEIAREGDLRCRRQIDVTEQNQLIVEKSLKDLGKHRRRHRFRKRDAGDLAAEDRVEWRNLEWPVAGFTLRFKLGLSHDNLPAGLASGRLWQYLHALPRLFAA